MRNENTAKLGATLSVVCLLCGVGLPRAPAQGAGSDVAVDLPEGRTFLVGGDAGVAVSGDSEGIAREHLSRNRDRYGLSAADAAQVPAGGVAKAAAAPAELKLAGVRGSLLGRHVHFRQYSDGIPVLGAGVTVSVSHTNKAVYRVHTTALPLDNRRRSGRAALDSEAALDRAWAHLRVAGKLNAVPKAEQVWVPAGDGLRLGYCAEIACSKPLGTWEVVLDAETGVILSSRNRMRTDSRKRGQVEEQRTGSIADTGQPVSRAEATAIFLLGSPGAAASGVAVGGAPVLFDSVAQGWGWVFDPDPKTALASDTLSNTSAPSAFAPAMVLRPLRDITFSGGLYRLTGPWVTIADFDLPATPPSTTAGGVWSFPRGNNGLNDAIVYFHLDQSQRYLQALGYAGARGIQARSIPADSDGVNGDDNSYFDPFGNRLSFGHGGVDDSEDADVVLHEYGHAIEYGIEPNFDMGDTGAIGEGFGDYWAGSYSLACSNGATFHPDWVFNWDGHNEFWAGRVLNSTGKYTPGSTYSAHAYVNGVLGDELWSAPLFQTLKRLLALGHPREEADMVVIESHFGMGYGTRIPAMASNVVVTALELYPGGPHAGIYYSEFTNRNILTNWPLPCPEIVFPPSGECLLTGMVRRVRWLPRPSPVPCGAAVEFRELGAQSAYWQNNVEGGTAGWTVSYSRGAKNWALVTTTNHSPATCWWADEQGVKSSMYLVSPSMVLSNGVMFSFWHSFNVQTNYDGGVVEISSNGGTTWVDVTTNVMASGYNTLRQISTAANNAIAGRMAFSGTSGGFVQSFIDLTRYGGNTVKIRFQMATDSSVRAAAPRGWWVDDMALWQDSWESVGMAGQGATSIAWKPPRPMTGVVVRVKATATGCADSAWATSKVFSVSVDTDGDALPDAWELAKFGSLGASSGTGDADGDGSSDYAEWIAGTSPTQAVSVFRMTDIAVQTTGTVSFGWTSVTGRSYTVEWTGDPAAEPFAVAASNIIASPVTNRWTETGAPNPAGVLRIRVDP